MISSHTFRGKRYRIKFGPLPDAWGQCDPPLEKGKTLYVDRTALSGCVGIPKTIPRGAEMLYISLHEAWHAAQFDLDEETIEECSTDATLFLWRLGFRHVPSCEA